jgi:arylsulfatase A-like enzyme
MEENTILIMTSDNGCSPRADFEELGAFGHHPSYHFRGYKADIYEGGHRIPFIARWPEKIKPNSVSDEIICLTDLMATCAAIVGEELADDTGEDSYSILPVMTDAEYEGPIREATVHHSINGSFSIRQGQWKLEMCPGSGGWSHPRPGKATEGLPPIQLYDMKGDVSEKRNVYQDHPEVVEVLIKLLTDYVKNGRSTPGSPQKNNGPAFWPQLSWMKD